VGAAEGDGARRDENRQTMSNRATVLLCQIETPKRDISRPIGRFF